MTDKIIIKGAKVHNLKNIDIEIPRDKLIVEALSGLEARSEGLYHGECVALGMLPMCSADVRKRLLPLLKRLALPTDCTLSKENVLNAITHDKKAEGKGVTAVIVDEIGSFRFETLSREAFAARIAEALPNIK